MAPKYEPIYLAAAYCLLINVIAQEKAYLVLCPDPALKASAAGDLPLGGGYALLPMLSPLLLFHFTSQHYRCYRASVYLLESRPRKNSHEVIGSNPQIWRF